MAEAAAVVHTAAARAVDIPAVGHTAGVEGIPVVQYIAVAGYIGVAGYIAVATDTAATDTVGVMDIAAATAITATVDIPGGEWAGDMARITQAITMAPITTPTIHIRHIPRPTSPNTHPSAVGLDIPGTPMAVIRLSRPHLSAINGM